MQSSLIVIIQPPVCDKGKDFASEKDLPWIHDLIVRKSTTYDVSNSLPRKIVLKDSSVIHHDKSQFLPDRQVLSLSVPVE